MSSEQQQELWETSEFSILEVLYMGSDSLVYVVEHTIGDALADPFEVIARLEEELGEPLAFTDRRTGTDVDNGQHRRRGDR